MGLHVKNNKSIQDKETFTRTKCTLTVVIYRYSSPSSFQLSENKKSKCKEQLKDPITQLFWRADTVEHIHMVAVSHSIYRTVHTYRCNLPVKVYTSAKPDAPPASDMASYHGRHTHAHTLTHTPTHMSMHAYETAPGTHIFFYIYTRLHQTHIPVLSHTHTCFSIQCCLLIIATKALQVDCSDMCALPVCILLYVIIRCCSTIKQTGVEGLALLSPGKDTRQRAQPHLLFLLLTLRLLQIF